MTNSRKRTRPSTLDHEPEAVTWARKKAGLTKRALAKMIGISEQLVNEIESGWRNATPANLAKLADALNCPTVVLERKRTETLTERIADTTASHPRRCPEAIKAPQSVLDEAEDIPGPKWMGLSRELNCALEEHEAETENYACVLNLAPPGVDAIWTHWRTGQLPTEVAILPGCPAYSEEKDSGCISYAGHPGVHGFDLRQENGMADETAEYGKRLRDLEAQAFRTGRTLAGHGEQPATMGEPQRTDFNRAIEQRLGAIERVLFALARAQGVDPETAG